MNRTYRNVWDPARRASVAAPEAATSRSKTESRYTVGAAALLGGLALSGPAFADCAMTAASATCDAAAPNPYASTIGTGSTTAPGYEVNVGAGAQIVVGDANAISIGNNGTINIGANALVQNDAPNDWGYYGVAGNTIEFGYGTKLTIGTGATVRSLNGGASEAINPMGDGNTIINYGTIVADHGTAFWFQNDPAYTGHGVNVLDNYGTIQGNAQDPGVGQAIGAGGDTTIHFTNRTGGQIIGNISLTWVAENVANLEAGSEITGALDVGGGTLNLMDSSTTPGQVGTISSAVHDWIYGVPVLNKQGTGAWIWDRGLDIGTVNVQSGRLILTDDNYWYTGGIVTIDAGATLQLGNGGTSGWLPAVSLAANNGTLAFNRADDVTYADVLSGNGGVRQMGPGTLTLAGANTYLGGTTVAGGILAVDVASTTSTTNLSTGAVHIASGATLQASTNDAFSFDNELTGTGTLAASNSNGVFSFAATAGSAFAGTVALSNNTFALGGVNTTALTKATLSVGAGNVTTVLSGNQNIGGLTFNGGTVIFDGSAPEQTVATSLITANVLDLRGTGFVRINVPNPYAPPTPTPAGDLSLFAQSHVNEGLQLVKANNVMGTVAGLTLKDQNGTTITGAAQSIDIQQGGHVVAVGDYNYMLGTGARNDGLYVGYGLTTLDLQAGQILTLTENAGATGNDMDLAAKLTGTGGLNVAANNVVSLSNSDNDFTGTTTVSTGTLRTGASGALSPNSSVTVAQGATLDLNGFDQTTAGLDNTGLVTLGNGSAPGTVLTVKGDYVGNNGQIVLNTVFDGDGSVTDKLVLDGGNASGSTDLVIKHAGGNGAQTNQGIRVVETRNWATTDATAFNLSAASDGYRAGGGTIVAGAYDYGLIRGGNGGVADDWYLTAMGNNCTSNASLCPADPQEAAFRPEVGAYMNNRLFAQTMQFHTLHDRQGEADAANDSNVWIRTEGRTMSREGALSANEYSYLVHAGADVFRFSDGGKGSIRIGAMGAFGTSNNWADNGSLTARGSVDGYSGGIYGTWYGNDDARSGPYIDSWIMYGTFDNAVKGQGLSTESYRSNNLSASLEAGYSFPLFSSANGTGTFIEPQGQVIVSDYDAGTHTEQNGTVVSGQSGTDVTTRLGVRLHSDALSSAATNPMQVFAEVNWWHGPASQSATFDGVTVRDGLPTNRLEGKVGLQGNVTEAMSVWGTVGFEVGANDYTAGEARVGLKYAW